MRKVLCAAALATMAVGAPQAMAQVGSGVYLRLDAGGGFSTDMTFKDSNPFALNSSLGSRTYAGDANNSPLFSAGLGYRFSPTFRMDLTGSYFPSFRNVGGLKFSGTNNFGGITSASAKITPAVALLNAYADFAGAVNLPPDSIQPYLVASLGASHNELGTFTISEAGATVETFDRHSKIDFAWGVGAGIGFPLGRFLTLDFMYKYLDLGEVTSSTQLSAGGITTTVTPITAQLHVHTITAGLRLGF